MQNLDTNKQTLYRFFDSSGQLLYVGISNNWISRLHQHYKNAEWFSQVTSATFEHFDTRAEVEKAEFEAIKTEGAIYNKAFNPDFESPFLHFQKIKAWVYSDLDSDARHQELVDELKISFRFDNLWKNKKSADLAFALIELLPVVSPDCEFCEAVFHSNQVNLWADKKRRDRKNATN